MRATLMKPPPAYSVPLLSAVSASTPPVKSPSFKTVECGAPVFRFAREQEVSGRDPRTVRESPADVERRPDDLEREDGCRDRRPRRGADRAPALAVPHREESAFALPPAFVKTPPT